MERVTSSFDISIATGLALESLFEPTAVRYDPERIIPNKIDISRYKGLIINFYTLVRNILNSFQNKIDFKELIKQKDKLIKIIIPLVEEEIETIQSLFLTVVSEDRLFIFLPNYASIVGIMNNGKDIEVNYIKENIELIKFCNYLIPLIRNKTVKVIKPINHKLPFGFDNDYLLLTHYAVDLLNSYNLKLLESHTGTVKSFNLFYTRFASFGKNDLTRIPFNSLTLFLFGDNSLVRTSSIKTKKVVLEIAESNKWTYKTTELEVKNKLLNTIVIDDIKKFKGIK